VIKATIWGRTRNGIILNQVAKKMPKNVRPQLVLCLIHCMVNSPIFRF